MLVGAGVGEDVDNQTHTLVQIVVPEIKQTKPIKLIKGREKQQLLPEELRRGEQKRLAVKTAEEVPAAEVCRGSPSFLAWATGNADDPRGMR